MTRRAHADAVAAYQAATADKLEMEHSIRRTSAILDSLITESQEKKARRKPTLESLLEHEAATADEKERTEIRKLHDGLQLAQRDLHMLKYGEADAWEAAELAKAALDNAIKMRVHTAAVTRLQAEADTSKVELAENAAQLAANQELLQQVMCARIEELERTLRRERLQNAATAAWGPDHASRPPRAVYDMRGP